MPNTTENCSVCLSSDATLIKTCETDSNLIKWSSKLSVCVPEVDWGEECYICQSCISQLEIAYTFHHLCLQSYEVRKHQAAFIKAEESDSQDFSNDYANDDDIRCRLCHKSFKSISGVNGHIAKVHAEQRKSRCLDSNISDSENGQSELKEEFFGELLEQKNCDSTNNKAKVRKKSKYPKQCEYCTKYFNRKQHLDTHIRRYHTLEKPFACDQCEARFATAHNLKIHKNRHTNNRPFICSSCGKTFTTSSCLYHHTQIHLNKRQYKCTTCDKCFNTTSILRAHKVCVHTDPKLWKYPCTFCEKRFPMKSGLTAHLRRHTGEKNFVCHICGKRFSDKDMVLKHFRSHTNERLYKCHLCAKEYKASTGLNVHLKREHDVGTTKLPKPAPKRYVCHLCSKGFVTGNKLEKHIRSHTGERPFACHVCGKKFTDGWYLKVHLGNKHGEEGVSDHCEDNLSNNLKRSEKLC